MDLTAAEIRVLGSLLEKQRVTPDVYPLSLNSLRLACNQSTNRDPVVDYQESDIREALRRLERRGFARLASGAGSRASKYRHLLAERLPMGSNEQAIICVLMLRGPQTPGELRQRAERMHSFGDLSEIHSTLTALIERGLVERQPRRPGQKEERFAHLLGGGEEEDVPTLAATPPASAPSPFAQIVTPSPPPSAPPASSEPHTQVTESQDGELSVSKVQEMEQRIERLEREVAELRETMRNP